MATISLAYRLPANVAVSALGDNSLVAAVGGQVIDVHALALTFASPVDVIFKDGSTVLGKFQQITELTLDQLKGMDRYICKTGDFIVNLSAAVACTGTLWYSQRLT